MNLYEMPAIMELLKKYELWAKKSFGQNFLISKKVLDLIVKTAEISSNDHIVEIGPGLGVLTNELAQKAKKVITVELDKNLLPLLSETLSPHKNIEIVNEDALKYLPPKTTYKVVANIPYNITSPLINHFLQNENKPQSMTLLVQKEVAEKICLKEPDMTILSLQTALFGEAKIIKTVPASSFFPSPKVDSAIIKITLYEKNSVNYFSTDEAQKILRLAKIAFSQKRKKIKNTIGSILENSPINLDRRPETLSAKDWKELLPHLKSP